MILYNGAGVQGNRTAATKARTKCGSTASPQQFPPPSGQVEGLRRARPCQHELRKAGQDGANDGHTEEAPEHVRVGVNHQHVPELAAPRRRDTPRSAFSKILTL